MRITVLLFLFSLSTFAEVDLSGHALGVARYKSPPTRISWAGSVGCAPVGFVIPFLALPGKTERYASRIFLRKANDELGGYNLVITEYHRDTLELTYKWVESNKFPERAKDTGFLKTILHSVTSYRAIPQDDGRTFDLYSLYVKDNSIKVGNVKTGRVLELSKKINEKNPLKGARITGRSYKNEPTEIFIPNGLKTFLKRKGSAYHLTKTAYKAAGLKSSWRDDFQANPYLGAYNDKDDVVLQLKKEGRNYIAEFLKNPDRSEGFMSMESREEQFTSPLSAHIEGEFEITEPMEGMFIFNAASEEQEGNQIVEPRIGMFIDIFDASVKLGQYVDELVLINPDSPTDFLMYYEHPDFGNKE